MTVIAWDGKTLAADKQAGTDYPRRVTKIQRLPSGELVGVAGWIDRGQQLVKWYVDGADPGLFPAFQADKEKFCELLIVRQDGTVWSLYDSPSPWRVEDGQHAIGSGRDFAAAAMYLGKSAAEAVAVASALCGTCGLGIDTLQLEAK